MDIIYDYCFRYINSNVNWKRFFNDNPLILSDQSSLAKTLGKIKRIGWVDKPPGEETDGSSRNDLLEEVTKVFTTSSFTDIGVLLFHNESFPSFIWKRHKRIAHVVSFIASILGIPCEVVSSVDEANKHNEVIPLSALVMDEKDVERIEKAKIILPTIDDHCVITLHGRDEQSLRDSFDAIHAIDNFVNHDEETLFKYSYIVCSEEDS